MIAGSVFIHSIALSLTQNKPLGNLFSNNAKRSFCLYHHFFNLYAKTRTSSRKKYAKSRSDTNLAKTQNCTKQSWKRQPYIRSQSQSQSQGQSQSQSLRCRALPRRQLSIRFTICTTREFPLSEYSHNRLNNHDRLHN